MVDPFLLSEKQRQELAPAGDLRMAIAVGPAASAVWCSRNADGSPHGVTIGIGRALAERWSLSLTLVEFSSSGDIVENAATGKWTLSCTPIDNDRRAVMEVGPNYYLGVSTYLARKASFADVSDVDKPGVRVVGVAGTATIRSAAKALHHATLDAIASLDEAVSMFRNGEADAVALGKETILNLVGSIEGTHAVSGQFHEAGTAIVAPKGRTDAIAAASQAIEAFKRDGTMRKIFDEFGMAHAEVAP